MIESSTIMALLALYALGGSPANAPKELNLSENYAPMLLQICEGSKSCRELRIGVRDGRLCSEGNITLQEAISYFEVQALEAKPPLAAAKP